MSKLQHVKRLELVTPFQEALDVAFYLFLEVQNELSHMVRETRI